MEGVSTIRHGSGRLDPIRSTRAQATRGLNVLSNEYVRLLRVIVMVPSPTSVEWRGANLVLPGQPTENVAPNRANGLSYGPERLPLRIAQSAGAPGHIGSLPKKKPALARGL